MDYRVSVGGLATMILDPFTNCLLLVFAVAFMGCVLTTPVVTRIAVWAGAVDRPDKFRRVHGYATPRMGGLGVAFGLGMSLLLVAYGGYLRSWANFPDWWSKQWAVILAGLIILAIGAIDDSRGIRPRLKLVGQTSAVLVLFLGGIQIKSFAVLGTTFDLSYPALNVGLLGVHVQVGLPSLVITLLWFLGCMNIWNLIDGLDGLAAGVGLLVCGTLMLIAIHQENKGAALMAAALGGSLAGFLLYNWHPACIFLGDCGSMLIGLLVGVIGVQYSLKKTSAVSLLFPLLAMGLPITDTAMAIFRRWVRNLPLTAADRRHVHHLLIGLGLDPRVAALLLYCFSAGLCGVVLLGVAFDKEFLAFIVGLSGCLAFLLILMSRRDELATLQADFSARFARRRQERTASRITWEAIQRIELCEQVDGIWDIVQDSCRKLGCDTFKMGCFRDGREVFQRACQPGVAANAALAVSGPTATFRLSSGQDLLLAVELHQSSDSPLAADIAFRFLQRLSLATAERLERLLEEASRPAPLAEVAAVESTESADRVLPIAALGPVSTPWDPFGWIRIAFGWESPSAERTTSLGDD